MANIWIYSEDTDVIKELVTAGKSLASEVNAIAVNEEVAKIASSLGVQKVVYLKGDSNWAESYGKSIADTLKEEGANVFLVGATPKGKSVAAQVAALMNAGLVTEAASVSVVGDGIETERFIYGGLAVSKEVSAFPAIATIPPRSYEAANESNAVEITVKDVVATSSVNVVSSELANLGGTDLNKADKVVAIGRGVEGEEGLAAAQQLADAIGAEIGCTRPVAEEGKLLPVERYIGISGKNLKGSLYLGVGLSGQVQHIAGIRDVKTVVAINTEESAPIFGASDYGIVGDYKEVLPALIDAIKAAK